MMVIREAIQEVYGFRYMTEKLEICSSLGRQCLLDTPWLSVDEIRKEYDSIEQVLEMEEQDDGREKWRKIKNSLGEVMDIRGTVSALSGQRVLDDPELFEIKNFALIVSDICKWVERWQWVSLPDLSPVVQLLDPENTRIAHFYIYGLYDDELAVLRLKMKKEKEKGRDEEEINRLYLKALEREDVVRKRLTRELKVFQGLLGEALQEIAHLDIVLAKAIQVRQMHLVRPVLAGEGETVYTGLFNPALCEWLAVKNKRFQPVDIRLYAGTALITGANMAGKTVLLKTVGLAQCLAQFGFFVPAAAARIVWVDAIAYCIGDEQDEKSGLSSFAAEMLRLNGIIRRIREKEKLLVLVDEPARTTNPVEGEAIVNGVAEIFTAASARALLTTHYGGITAPCRKWRVRGLREEAAGKQVSWKELNDCIDYSLEEDRDGIVPHEAVRIARILGVDRELMEATERFLTAHKSLPEAEK